MFRDSFRALLREQHTAAFAFCLFVFALLLHPEFFSPHSFAQTTSTASSERLELPVTMRQDISAGSTAVGAKVQARLSVATLVHGVVLPEGATLSGEVTESLAKSRTEASRLAIRVDSAQWKNGSAPTSILLAAKVYLTAWYYPPESPTSEDFPEVLPEASRSRQRRGGASYPNPNTSDSPPRSRGNTGKEPGPVPNSPAPSLSQHRAQMKDVESKTQSDGSVTLSSTRSNIKLNRSTTYVFATSSQRPVK